MKNVKILSVFICFFIGGLMAVGQNDSNDIVENAMMSKDHSTLVAAVKAADLVDVLKSDGPFTVFAPVNSGFEALPDGTVESLLKKENQKQLQAVLTYHVVSGDLKASDVVSAIKKGNGTATLTTVHGSQLKATLDGDKVKITDTAGNTATVVAADIDSSNGVIHAIDTVLLPTK
ncbi:fasciclin domain-containing protein [Christiangramia oceanisediminis]